MSVDEFARRRSPKAFLASNREIVVCLNGTQKAWNSPAEGRKSAFFCPKSALSALQNEFVFAKRTTLSSLVALNRPVRSLYFNIFLASCAPCSLAVATVLAIRCPRLGVPSHFGQEAYHDSSLVSRDTMSGQQLRNAGRQERAGGRNSTVSTLQVGRCKSECIFKNTSPAPIRR